MSKFYGAWIYFNKFNNEDKIYFSELNSMLIWLKDNPNLEIKAMNVIETITKEEVKEYLKKIESEK